jgi:outer membrane immunogenic protein
MFRAKEFLVAFAAGVAGIGTAGAADMPVKAPPIPVVTYNWTGCYVGANVGWKGGRFFGESVDVPATTGPVGTAGIFTVPRDHVDLDNINANSAIAGGQGGCRWETAQHWVFGFEGDIDWTDLHGTVTNRVFGPGTTFVPGDTFDNRMRWEGSARAIVGRAWDRLLVYGTGGVAFAEVTMTGNFIPSIGVFTTGRAGLYPPSVGSDSQVLVGGTIGAGLAYMINKNWEIGGEYRYTRYQGADFGVGQVAGICQTTAACLNQNVTGHKTVETNEVMVKLNYRFDWAGPVVARY